MTRYWNNFPEGATASQLVTSRHGCHNVVLYHVKSQNFYLAILKVQTISGLNAYSLKRLPSPFWVMKYRLHCAAR